MPDSRMGPLCERLALQVDFEVLVEALRRLVRISAVTGVASRPPDQIDADLFRPPGRIEQQGDLAAQDRVVRGLAGEGRRVEVEDVLEERNVDRVARSLEEGDHPFRICFLYSESRLGLYSLTVLREELAFRLGSPMWGVSESIFGGRKFGGYYT